MRQRSISPIAQTIDFTAAQPRFHFPRKVPLVFFCSVVNTLATSPLRYQSLAVFRACGARRRKLHLACDDFFIA